MRAFFRIGLLSVLVFSLASCELLNLFAEKAGAKFTWTDPTARGLLAKSSSTQSSSGRDVPVDAVDPSLEATMAYYSTIGTKVGSYTPRVMKIFLEDISLESKESVTPDGGKFIFLSPAIIPGSTDDLTNGYMDQFYADFTNPDISFVPSNTVPTGFTYPILFMSLMAE